MLPAGSNPTGARVASSMLADLLDRGRAGGYPADIKMVYSVAGDLFNQVPNVGRIVAAAQRLEFMVVHDNFLTPTARHADIVLPATTFWERNDVHVPWAGAGHYVIFMKKAVEPPDVSPHESAAAAAAAGNQGVPSGPVAPTDATTSRAPAATPSAAPFRERAEACPPRTRIGRDECSPRRVRVVQAIVHEDHVAHVRLRRWRRSLVRDHGAHVFHVQ